MEQNCDIYFTPVKAVLGQSAVSQHLNTRATTRRLTEPPNQPAGGQASLEGNLNVVNLSFSPFLCKKPYLLEGLYCVNVPCFSDEMNCP